MAAEFSRTHSEVGRKEDPAQASGIDVAEEAEAILTKAPPLRD